MSTSAELVLALHAVEGASKGKSAANYVQCAEHGPGDLGLRHLWRVEGGDRFAAS